jgi:hypothetical protein
MPAMIKSTDFFWSTRQILSHSTEKDYFVNNLPWLIGSLGTMVEDVTIFIQFRIYARPAVET